MVCSSDSCLRMPPAFLSPRDICITSPILRGCPRFQGALWDVQSHLASKKQNWVYESASLKAVFSIMVPGLLWVVFAVSPVTWAWEGCGTMSRFP